jgi:hypothetical protein
MSRRAQKGHSLGRSPTKSMMGGTRAARKGCSQQTNSMAGEIGAEMAAPDMAGEISSVAARHCSLPLQCKCTSSGDHLKQVGLATAAHCRLEQQTQVVDCISGEPHGIALKIIVIIIHVEGQSAHLPHLPLMSQPSVTSSHPAHPTAKMMTLLTSREFGIPCIPQSITRASHIPRILRHYIPCIPEPSTGIPHVPRVLHHIRPIYHSRKTWGASYTTETTS